MKTYQFFIVLILLLILSSCSPSGRRERTVREIALEGEKVNITSDASLYEIVYADTNQLVASVLSPTNLLISYRMGENTAPYEFLRVGRGPLEVMSANVKSRLDTLFVLSHTSSGLHKLIKIPVVAIRDVSRWKSTDISSMKGISIGSDFDVLPSASYIMTGGKFGTETVLTEVSERKKNGNPVAFWPEDGCPVAPITKQNMYIRGAKVFSNEGSKVLYACGEGRYFSILDLSSESVSETFIYDEYPKYHVASDGINAERKPESLLGGMVYATDSLVFLSPLDCHLENANFVPDNYKSYPPDYNDRIEVYDWNGTYICTYVMDMPFGNFYVNGRVIYTLTLNNETFQSEVYRYRF